MPGRFFLTRDPGKIAASFGTEVPHTTPRRNIKPGEEVLVWTGEALVSMRWGIIPVGRVNARGRPVMETIVNARSETVFDKSAFAGVGRAVIPVDGWYEWTGETRRKQAWRITRRDGGLIFFAAITDRWTAPGGQMVDQVAPVTCAPSADVRDIHHRMGVILDQADMSHWTSGDEETAKGLARPSPDGSLCVSPADDVDWTAP